MLDRPVTPRDRRPAPADRVADVLAGARAMAPWLAGIVPFGLVIGVSAAQADIPTLRRLAHRPAPLRRQRPGRRHRPPRRRRRARGRDRRRPRHQPPPRPLLGDDGTALARHAAMVAGDSPPTVLVDASARRRGRRLRAKPPTVARGHRHYLGGAGVLWVAWVTAIARRRHRRRPAPRRAPPRARHPALPRRRGRRPGDDHGPPSTRPLAAVVAAAVLYPVPLHLGPVLAIAAGTVAGLRAEAAEGADDERLARRRPRRCRELPVPHQHARGRRSLRRAGRHRAGGPVRRARRLRRRWPPRRSPASSPAPARPPSLRSSPSRSASPPCAGPDPPAPPSSPGCRPCGCWSALSAP